MTTTANVILGDCMDVLPTLPAGSRDSRGRLVKGTACGASHRFRKGEHWRERKPFWDRDWLFDQYVTRGRSANDIASDFGISPVAITFWLKKHGINRRTTAETRKLKKWSLVGKKNGMYGKRGPLSPAYVSGTTPWRQHIYASHEWGQFARSIYARDAKCLVCGSRDEMELHHIDRVCDSPLLIMDPSNCMILCYRCHKGIQGKEKKNAKRLRAILKKHLEAL